jgi:hypothetical protein
MHKLLAIEIYSLPGKINQTIPLLSDIPPQEYNSCWNRKIYIFVRLEIELNHKVWHP